VFDNYECDGQIEIADTIGPLKKDLIIDCFAGGGGASVGIEMALGRPVDIAINHDPQAIRMHKVNHPDTLHLTEDIFKVDLKKYVAGRHVSLMWASPDCTSHSKAKGGQPRNKGLRILPWAVYKHAKAILPDVILMENVEEIQQWGPLDEAGHPIKERAGEDYKRFIAAMKRLGYDFDSRELVAADYGAPTTRKRWYAIFRRDGNVITWPEPTHSKSGADGRLKWLECGDYIDWSDLGRSIFDRPRPGRCHHETDSKRIR
ncbi:MAG: DNA cytosine methyltransferase, partial [Hungatella hathewayi]